MINLLTTWESSKLKIWVQKCKIIFQVTQQILYGEKCLGVNDENVGVMVGCDEELSRWSFGTYFDSWKWVAYRN